MSADPRPTADAGFDLGLNDSTLALAAAAILILGAVLWTARSPNVEKTDFSLTYVGARIVYDGMGSRLYDPALQRNLRDSLFAHPVPLFFEHPPFEALLLSSLARHSFRTAYLVWGLLNAAVWIILIFALRSFAPCPRDGLAYVGLWLLFAPLWVSLYQGQSSIIVLGAYSLAFVFLKRANEFAAGVAIGLGLFKFQFVLPFVVIFAFRKRFRFVAGFLVSALVLVVVSIAAIGWQGVTRYVRFLLEVGNNLQNISYGSGVDMPTIHGFVFATLGNLVGGTSLNLVVAVLSLTLLAWIAWTWRLVSEDRASELMFAAAAAASLLCGSHMFAHDFSPLILPLFLSLGASPHGDAKSRETRIGDAIFKIASLMFWIFPIYFLFVKWHCLYLMGPLLLLFTWGAMRRARSGQCRTAIAATS